MVGSIATQDTAYGVYVTGGYAYVASDDGLEVYDVSTPSSPSYVRTVQTGLDFLKVRGAGNYLYATAYSDDTLRIFDISGDPSNPSLVGTYNPATSPGSFSGDIRGLYVDAPNDLVYFVNDQADLYIVDVSSPSSPSTEGYLFLPGGNSNFPGAGVHVHRDYAYVATADGNDHGDLYWIDVSDTSNPTEIASLHDNGFGFNEPYAEDCWIHVAAHDGWKVYKMTGFQPDNQIKNDGEASYIGDDIYNDDGSGQTKSQEVYPNVTATYQIKVENDADRNDEFTQGHISPGPVPSGWTVQYFDGATDVTAQVMAGTYSTGDLSAHGSIVITLEVTPDGTVACDAYIDVQVRAVSTECSDGCVDGSEDVVVARTTLRCPEPEITMSKTLTSGDPAYVGQEISFTIRITNTGVTTITVLPLQDVYDPDKLDYLGAVPASDDNVDDGVIDWSDLTAGLGSDLAPTQAFAVVVRFQAAQATALLSSQAAVGGLESLLAPQFVSPLAPQSTPGNPVFSQFIDDCVTGDHFQEGVYGNEPDPGCDSWTQDLYERPYNNSDHDHFFPDVDVVKAAVGQDGGWYFFKIDLFGLRPTGGGILDAMYAIELQVEGDSCTRWLLTATSPTTNLAYGSWGQNGVIAYYDTDGDVGGAHCLSPDAGWSGSGYEDKISDQGGGADPDGLWAMIPNDDHTVVYLAAQESMLGNPASIKWRAWAEKGLQDNANFHHHDKYTNSEAGDAYQSWPHWPTQNVYEDDNTPFKDYPPDECECDGGITVLTVAYRDPGGHPVVDIELGNDASFDPSDPNDDWRYGVADGDTLVVYGTKSGGKLGANTKFKLYEGVNNFQTVEVHTSCSQPIYSGQLWGDPGAIEVLVINPVNGWKNCDLSTIGDYVWHDADGQGDQDEGPGFGLNDVKVELYGGLCPLEPAGLITDTMTAGDGDYDFTDLPPGNYCVNVDDSTVPLNYVLTTANEPLNVSIGEGADYNDADFGYREQGTASIGDRVFYDQNEDGLPDDDGEPGINGVTVKLYSTTCPPSGGPMQTQVTSGSGDYDFTNLVAGTYCVDVDESTLPAGLSLTTGNEPHQVTVADDDDYNDADFGYWSVSPCGDGTRDVAMVSGAEDQYGRPPPDVWDDACVEIVAGDARISISPGSDTNDVGDSHTFVIHTEKKPGGSWVDAAGVVVTVTFPGGAPGTVDTSDCDVVGTDANGECEVVINSSDAGEFTAHAAADIEVVSGFILHRETDGTGGNSGDAAKTYVGAKIELDPLNAANQVRDEHIITATVQVHDGTAWGPALDGATVTFSLKNNTAGAFFVGGINTCLTSGGSCSVTINGNVSGSVDIHALTDVSVGGLVLHRETDGAGSNSGDAQKIYVVSDYEISKTLNGPDAVSVNRPISFTIRITNTGDTTITVLPLRDVYSTTYLTYGYTDTVTTWTDPDSDDHNDDGEINWSDLTLTQGDLAPSASITVIVTFTAKADTTLLQPDSKTENTAIADGAKADPDGGGPLPEEDLPQKQDSDRVQVVVPTGVVMGSLNAVAQPDGVLISWQTANEVRILGFDVLRRGVGGELEQVGKEFIFAEYAGADHGSDYAYLDKGVVSGWTYDYVLEAIMSDGRVERYDVPAVTARWWLQLPLLLVR